MSVEPPSVGTPAPLASVCPSARTTSIMSRGAGRVHRGFTLGSERSPALGSPLVERQGRSLREWQQMPATWAPDRSSNRSRWRQLASVGLEVTPGGDAGAPPPPRTRTPRLVHDDPSKADRTFNLVTMAAGISVLVLLTLVGFFLLWQSSTRSARPGSGSSSPASSGAPTSTAADRRARSAHRHGAGGARRHHHRRPVRRLAALAITEYAGAGPASGSPASSTCWPPCPALLFGIWGFLFLSDQIIPISKWLTDHFGVHPVLQDRRGRPSPGRSSSPASSCR